MARKLSQVINDENYFEYIIPIGRDAVEYIVRGLQEKYTAKFTVRMEPNYLMDNLITVSMFFDTQRNRLYLTYKLDRDRVIALRAYDSELFNRVFDNLQKWIVRDYDIKLSIVGDPTSLPEYSLNREYGNVDMNDLYLRNCTQYLWTINGLEPNGASYTYFVDNRNMLIDDIKKRLVRESVHKTIIDNKPVYDFTTPEDIMPEFNARVNEINEKYNFYRNRMPDDPEGIIFRDYNAAFAEYQNIYNEYFNRIPENIPEWKAFTISINVEHDFNSEKMDYQDHPCGRYINPDEVEHYIAKWGYDHGKYVPQEILNKWGIN